MKITPVLGIILAITAIAVAAPRHPAVLATPAARVDVGHSWNEFLRAAQAGQAEAQQTYVPLPLQMQYLAGVRNMAFTR